MAHDQFRGVFPYLVSPIDERGRVNEPVLTRLVIDLIDAGIHGLTLPAIERLAKACRCTICVAPANGKTRCGCSANSGV